MLEVVILIGLQAAGKTTFSRQVLGGHEQVSKDHFPKARNRQRRQLRLIADALEAGRDVVVDNTNPSAEEWRPIVEVARAAGARVVGYWFAPDPVGSLERNALRDAETRVPQVGMYATLKRLRQPVRDDGFDELFEVRFDGAGGFDLRGMGD
ncbi:ATP-binding protein [Amycolatopsis sp. H20-H5]|uniref:ATP-binding protein n=1 Tax=Amycolatopsis sp. H20-H5 TaxID=3046309 RepID=UPI002DBA21AC|nr:ATP-binding protein [Amycolatopsis sp. H20-H5]MEC3981139.1 ATP-binding protein [Amycolatopsis sp. H20-H5]